MVREKKSSKALGKVGKPEKRLDISDKFSFQDKSETFWKFGYETISGEEGWFAWIRKPNSEEYFCIGRISEAELIRRLKANPPALNVDDLIDLELWMKNGGLDQYIPKVKEVE